jgi:hypothetical protein
MLHAPSYLSFVLIDPITQSKQFRTIRCLDRKLIANLACNSQQELITDSRLRVDVVKVYACVFEEF